MFINHYFKHLTFLLSFLLSLCSANFLTGCSSGPSYKKVVVDYQSFYEKEFSKRSQPARISSSSGNSLKKSGHFMMGTLAVEHTDRVCWRDSSCDSNSHNETPTAVLIREASAKGGDLVVLQKKNHRDSRKIQKKGDCIRSKTQCQTRWVSDYRQECSGVGSSFSCRSVPAGGHSETTCFDVCQEWTTIYGTLHYISSIGTVWRNDPGMVQEIETLAMANRTGDIFKAVQDGDVKRFKELLAMDEGNSPGSSEKKSLLLAAVQNQQYKMFTLLKPTKKDVNVKAADHLTALHYAVEQKNPQMAKMLIEKGANINARDKSGNTPLHRAISKGRNNSQTIRLLLQKGADVNAQDKYQYTPLHFATMYRDTPVVQLLLDQGADVNKTNFKGDTVLHKAVLKLDLKGIQLLLDQGANVNTKNKKGFTPLKEANRRTKDKKKAVELLKKHGATL